MDKTDKITEEEKLQFVGETLTDEVFRTQRLILLMQSLTDRVERLEAKYNVGNKGIAFEMSNELTFLHNEVRDIKTYLGMYGDIPKIQPPSIKPKTKYTGLTVENRV